MILKTEEATPRRLRKARSEGDSAVSAFAAQASAFVVALALAPAAARAVAFRASSDLAAAIARTAHPLSSPPLDPVALADAVLSLTMPILVATALTSCALQIVQTGGVVASGVMAPKLERLDWTSGVKRLCSAARLFVLPRALVGGMAVAWIAMGALVHRLPDLARTAGRAPAVGSIVADMVGALGWRVCFVALGLALVDIVVSRRAWRRRLRMTRDEVKREQRESEGDPQSKEARQRAHGEMLTQTIPTRVRNASVVVVDPAHHACALRYDEIEGDRAPVVVARGEGELADRIVRSAHEFGVSVVTDAWLARALLDLDVGAIIPETLFDAVAALLREIRSASESAVVLSPPAAPVRPR